MSICERPAFLLDLPVSVSDPVDLVGASVAIERIARIVAPAIVQETTWSIPAIARIMLAKLPSIIIGLEANGSTVPPVGWRVC